MNQAPQGVNEVFARVLEHSLGLPQPKRPLWWSSRFH